MGNAGLGMPRGGGGEYGTSSRTATRDAPKLHDDGNTNIIYGAEPQRKPLERQPKRGEGGALPMRTVLFGFRIEVDKYCRSEQEGGTGWLVREKMERVGFSGYVPSAEVNRRR